MYIILSFCHGSDWMLRVRRETTGSMDPNAKHTLYGLDSESLNSWPCSVGHLEEGDELRHCIIEVCNSRDFDACLYIIDFFQSQIGQQERVIILMNK